MLMIKDRTNIFKTLSKQEAKNARNKIKDR